MSEVLECEQMTMEKDKLSDRRHRNSMQIIDVTNNMRASIHVRYAPYSTITAEYPSSFWKKRAKAVKNEETSHWDDNRKKRRKKMLPPTEVRGTFKNYCEDCTIHGLKYVGDTSLHKLERIFWMISVTISLCGCAFYIWHLYSKFTTSPIIISRSSQTVAVDEIPFPSLTVCNMNVVKKSLVHEILQGKDELQNFLLEDVCKKDGNPSLFVSPEVLNEASQWSHRINFMQQVSPSCSEMLYYCKWNSKVKNCSDLFKPVFTDDGICCNFNSVKEILWQAPNWTGLNISTASNEYDDWNPEYVFKETDSPAAIPWRGRGSGVSHGLTLALDVHIDDYYCSSTASVGFKMLLHSPVELARIAYYGFSLTPGIETRVIITPHINDADEAVRKISPKIRKCYFSNERRLRYYRTYTDFNCQLECEANFTLRMCQCMQYYISVEADTKICGKLDDNCTAKAKKLVTDYMEDNDSKSTTIASCKCYPGCHEINYSTEISQSMLVATFEVNNKYLKNNATYSEKNVAIVHVFYIDSSYVKYTKSELYGFVDLLSNTGGLLGLFMGFSLMSVMEIMYYVLLWMRRRRMLQKIIAKDKTNVQTTQTANKNREVFYPFAQ